MQIQTGSSSSEPILENPTPHTIFEAAFGFMVTRALATAVELDLFSAIARGQTTVEKLTANLGCSANGTSALLRALVALRFLDVTGGSYSLAAPAAAYLTRTSPQFIGGYVSFLAARCWPAWAHFSDVIRSGRPSEASHGVHPDSTFYSDLAPAIHNLSSAAASAAARILGKGTPQSPKSVLDVAAGSGVWSLAIAKVDHSAGFTIIDLPEVVDRVTRKFVDADGHADRFTFQPGNLRTMDFGEGLFDLVILGHICHAEGAARSRSLIQRAFRALRPGGQILIADLLADEDQRGPWLSLVFALQMLVMTEEGGVFTFAEFESWLLEAGFVQVKPLSVPAPSPLILATKP